MNNNVDLVAKFVRNGNTVTSEVKSSKPYTVKLVNMDGVTLK